MIIGSGLLAKIFAPYDQEGILFFASGVSNSLEVRVEEFAREENLLKESLKKYKELKLIYFSTCSIYDPTKNKSPYVNHKKRMEQMVAEHAAAYTVLRIGNVVGAGGNPNTLFNFLSQKIAGDSPFTLYRNARRVLIDAEHIASFFDSYHGTYANKTINVSYPYQFSMYEIVAAMEKYFQKTALYSEVDEGDRYGISFPDEVELFFKDKFPAMYLQHLVEKYATRVTE